MYIELIRHGETVLQARKCYQGAIDVPLSPEGRKKLEAGRAAAAGHHDNRCLQQAPEPVYVYVSPLCRARETASILFPGASQIVIPDLEEMHFGSFEGKNYLDMEKDPDYRAWVDGMCLGRCPGGESRQEFADRTCRAFRQILRMEAEGKNEAGGQYTPVVIVAHGGTQMALLDCLAETGDRAERDYYSWQLPCGHGYLLQTLIPDHWPEEESVLGFPGPGDFTEKLPVLGVPGPVNFTEKLPVLRILGTRDFTGQ